MRIIYIVRLSLITLLSCNQSAEKVNEVEATAFAQHVIKQNNKISTVGIDSFILITNNFLADEQKAKDIMEVKRNWPLAMQNKDRSLFESILAKQFTFRADNEFFNRKEYIEDRVKTPTIVDTAVYENLVLQFFGNTALLSYRNVITGKDAGGIAEKWQYSWADVYTEEKGKWKIAGSHLIQELRLK
jgi:ketosteroid isomerase-like protein